MTAWTEQHPRELDRLLDAVVDAAAAQARSCMVNLPYDPAPLDRARARVVYFAHACAEGRATRPGPATRYPAGIELRITRRRDMVEVWKGDKTTAALTPGEVIETILANIYPEGVPQARYTFDNPKDTDA